MKPLILFSILSLLSFPVPAQEEHEYEKVVINGNSIAYSCEGPGPGTVLLIAGMGLDAHNSFKNIYHNYTSEGYRICMYDRAGVGASSFANPRVRPMSELVDELHELVEKTYWKDIILVAHSFGGFLAQGYVNSHPGNVKAVLFAEAAGESWYNNMKSHMSEEGWSIMESIIEWEKATNSREDFIEAFEAQEHYTFPKSLPITVMSRGITYTNVRQAGLSYDDVDVYNITWDYSQLDLLKLSENNSHIIMRYSDHLVDENDPWLVLEEIYKLQDRVK